MIPDLPYLSTLDPMDEPPADLWTAPIPQDVMITPHTPSAAPIIFPGFWCDVFPHPEGIGMVVFEPNALRIVLYVNQVARSYMPVPEALLYLRGCADAAGDVAFIAQPHTTPNHTMIGVIGATARVVPVICWNRPAVGFDGDVFVYYSQTSDRTWRRFFASNLDTPDRPIPIWPGGTGFTSQGFSQVVSGLAMDGSQDHIIWHDEMTKVTAAGLTMYNAVQANGVMVGQGQDTGMVGLTPEGRHFLAMDFAPQEPRIAYSVVRGVWAVCSHNLQPVVGYAEMPPFVPLEDGPPPPNGDPTIPPSTPIITIPGYTPIPQASYGRPGIFALFFNTDLRTGNFAAPGNSEMIVNGTVTGGNQIIDRPIIVTLQSTGNDPAHMLGFFTGANDDGMANAGIQAMSKWHKAHYPKSVLIRYQDSDTTQDFINQCERDAIVGVQAYPHDGESLSASMQRFTASMDRVIASGRQVAVVRGLNTKFGGLQRVLDIQDPLCGAIRVRPHVVGDLPFSYARWYAGVESGAAFSAELKAWVSILAPLFTGLP